MNNEIKKVEQRLEKAIKSKDSVLEQASLHLLSSGGKRVRPAFVILRANLAKMTKRLNKRIKLQSH